MPEQEDALLLNTLAKYCAFSTLLCITSNILMNRSFIGCGMHRLSNGKCSGDGSAVGVQVAGCRSLSEGPILSLHHLSEAHSGQGLCSKVTEQGGEEFCFVLSVLTFLTESTNGYWVDGGAFESAFEPSCVTQVPNSTSCMCVE